VPAPRPTSFQRREYLRLAPKVELHVHLEGALRPQRLWQILRRHDLHPEIESAQELHFLYQHRDFDEFLAHFRWAVMSLRAVRDVREMALDLCRELVAQNVVYAEVIFSPGIFQLAGMDLEELLAAVTDAADEALGDFATSAAHLVPRYNFVIDLVRNFGPEAAERLVTELVRLRHPRVVGIHLGGDEAGFPARLFERAFAAAREAGLGLAAHAGEGDGPQSVRDALEVLGVARVGHGVRSLEDPALVHELVRRRTTLEVCPTSNVCTGVVQQLEAHPLPALLEAGVRATLGADDPSYFDTDLTRELWAAHEKLGLDLDTLDALVDNGLEAAFIAVDERQARLADLKTRRASARRALEI
jgi:adenosine deaminase